MERVQVSRAIFRECGYSPTSSPESISRPDDAERTEPHAGLEVLLDEERSSWRLRWRAVKGDLEWFLSKALRCYANEGNRTERYERCSPAPSTSTLLAAAEIMDLVHIFT